MIEPVLSQSANITNASSSFASSGGLVGAVGVAIVIVLVILGSTTAYRWLLEATGYFAKSVEYALKGVVTAVFVGVVSAPFYLLTQLDADARGLLLRGVAVVIVVYAMLVALGFIGDTLWSVVKHRHVEATGHEPFENWGTEESEE